MSARRAALTILCPALLGASVPARQDQAGEWHTGVYCVLAIYSALQEIGRQCYPGQDPAYQAALDDGVKRLGDHVLASSDMTAEQLDRFKAQMSERDQPAGSICKGDGSKMYQGMRQASPEQMRSAIDKLIAKPGKPEWGPCL